MNILCILCKVHFAILTGYIATLIHFALLMVYFALLRVQFVFSGLILFFPFASRMGRDFHSWNFQWESVSWIPAFPVVCQDGLDSCGQMWLRGNGGCGRQRSGNRTALQWDLQKAPGPRYEPHATQLLASKLTILVFVSQYVPHLSTGWGRLGHNESSN